MDKKIPLNRPKGKIPKAEEKPQTKAEVSKARAAKAAAQESKIDRSAPKKHGNKPGGRGGKNGGGNGQKLRGPLQKKNDKMKTKRREAMNASRRNSDSANKMIERANKSNYEVDPSKIKPAFDSAGNPVLRVIGMGGMDSGGSKNMVLVEYGNDALVMDVGIDLGTNLPGINFMIPDFTYLHQIKHKVRGYVFTHGHLDHIGGAPYIIPKIPAPVYGSRFTLAMLERIMEGSPATPDKFELKKVILNQHNNERLKVGPFVIELVRVTHAIPGSTAVVVDTPVGRLINTGDFKLDPDPLNGMPTDIDRLKALGEEGVLALLSESTSTDKLGRTPTEQSLIPSFEEIMKHAPGRVFVALFSTNMDRIQALIDAAVRQGRKVAFDGRSMIANLEVAVRNGFVRIPQGTVIPIASSSKVPDNQLLVLTTGAQGEDNSALRRMTQGDHRHIKLKAQDTAVLSSTPIPTTGNDALIESLVDDALRKGIHIYQHATHEVDKVGPLHVSGHAKRDDYADMIRFTKPKFFMPIMGSFTSKRYHIDLAVENGLVPREDCINAELGEVVEFTKSSMKSVDRVSVGSTLVDNAGNEVSNVVIKDRLLLAQDGLLTVILTVKKGSGQLVASPDIITRGFVYIKDSTELMDEIRKEARFMAMRKFKGSKLDDFKQELRDHIQHLLYERTERSPIVIPVVNIVGGGGGGGRGGRGAKDVRPDKKPPTQADKDFES